MLSLFTGRNQCARDPTLHPQDNTTLLRHVFFETVELMKLLKTKPSHGTKPVDVRTNQIMAPSPIQHGPNMRSEWARPFSGSSSISPKRVYHNTQWQSPTASNTSQQVQIRSETIPVLRTTRQMRRVGFADTQTSMLPGKPGSAMCVQSLNDSRGLAIRITYRISLRSSSLWEPRHPLLKVVND